MASSSFYSGSSQDATNVNAVEDSKNAAALSEAAAAASAAASANSAASVSAFATTATTKASESAASATASSTSAAASQASRVASEAAKVAAETAKTAAETARDAASVSEVASGAAEVAAEAAEINAAASAAAALSSKNAAATSASTASTKATESATSAAASEASNVAAGVAKVAAETAETAAQTAQTAAEAAQAAAESAETNAATSETNAATSASTATTQANIATTRAEEAVGWATASASSATASEAAKDAALAALDNFDDRYLGAKASDPTVDNDGNALVSGALYFNTTDDTMKVYEGSQWVAAYASLSGALLATNNLSDLTSASTGRANLGLGTAATTASTDYATAAQGGLAATATQPGDLATVATSGAYSDLSGTPALGTAASTASSAYATAAQGTLADSATQPGDLATVATSGAYGDLSGTPTLGTAAATASTDYATAAQGTLADSAVQPNDSAALKELDLSAIAANITDTAVDVFVYRTADDSDGGAWRKRTQGTSWYNETLNTATRGSRKEFPAVAVIVAESNQVTIYDGDDPDLPMWMVFDCADGNDMLRGIATNAITSIAMLNGMLSVCGQSAGFIRVNYLSEYSDMVDNSRQLVYLGNVSDRNSASGFSANTGNSSSYIVSYFVNDVAMTVLPNAPIDAATGLPVPTIAVATDGGVSVIKDDGTVVDLTDSGGGQSTKVMFTQDGKLAYAHDGATSIRIDSIPSSDFSYGSNKVARGNSEEFYVNSELISSGWSGETPKILEGSFAHKGIIVKSDPSFGLAQTGSKGLTRLDRSLGEGGRARNMVQYTTSTYNTGWMNGDIKLATLSDTDATNVTGSELVTNGTFDTDTSGWSSITSTLSVVSNALQIEQTSGTGWAYQGITTVVGKTYTLSFDVKQGTTPNYRVYVGTTAGDSSLYYSGTLSAGASFATLSATFTATSTTTVIQFGPWAASTDTILFDNISVRLAEEDRSVNGNGLQVFGTITKSAVATGADLVAYSNWGLSNYLMQPPNADIAGNSDRTFVTWFKTSYTSNFSYLFSITGSSRAYGLAVTLTDGYLYTYDNVNGSDDTTTAVADGNWHCAALVHSGGYKKLYVDGKLAGTFAASDVTFDSDANLYLGVYYTGSSFNYNLSGGSMALFRMSHTAASPEQIKKIYEDEKVLFQENAQATLYGSSDAVTALAYDDTTELLHVGTSAGRSVFQGLRRVDNTTDAVGAAISASNGLVAED